MKIIHLINVFVSFLILDARYSLYYSDSPQQSNSAFDCLYAHLVDDVNDENMPFMSNYNLIPYCRRLDKNEKQENFVDQSSENVKNTIKFIELYQQNITSTQLLEWSAPLDVAERYEKNGNNSNELFFNCSLPWFGSKCQYKFDVDIPPPFKNVIQYFIGNRLNAYDSGGNRFSTCYTFVTDCYGDLSPICLDWRQICDGRFDCPGGEDEKFCELLEINECSGNEFRCHFGGQCIPSEFVRDGNVSTDCLDGTDEMDRPGKLERENHICLSTGTFQCEELGRRYLRGFSCGDGEFIDKKLSRFILAICSNNRDKIVTSVLLTSLDYISNLKCQQAFSCLLQFDHYNFGTLPPKDRVICESLIKHCTSEWIVFPEYPILFGLFQFIYLTNRTITDFDRNTLPDFICFNASQCPALVSYIIDIGMHNGLNCCRMNDLMKRKTVNWYNLREDFLNLTEQCLKTGKDQICSHPSLFHCPSSSKCISKHRVADGEKDCYFGEDESFSACNFYHSWRYICETNKNKCLSMIAVRNGRQDCPDGEDERTVMDQNIIKEKVPFAFFCDEEYDLPPMNGSNDTDETHCELWPCNTPNVRCDNVWHCLNGADELNCPGINCSLNEFECPFGFYKQYICVSALHIMETYKCNSRSTVRDVSINNGLYNHSMNYFLWNETKCITGKQIYSCKPLSSIPYEDTCLIDTETNHVKDMKVELSTKNVEGGICTLSSTRQFGRQRIKFLTTSRLGYVPSISTVVSSRQATNSSLDFLITLTSSSNKTFYCDRGIHIYFNDNQTEKCLCPPSYFGNRCQWQNQRISLTLHFIHRTLTYTTSVFQVIIMIIDEQQQIAPYHEQIIYVPTRDCSTKFNVYLLDPDRPKNLSANYSIHIDVFNKITLEYWASWHLSIPFHFLPVNRIATQIFIPINPAEKESCSLSCGQHGRCIRYINKNLTYFCQCDKGYSGLHCDIQHNHSCSSDSYSLTSSICICPLIKFGPKCYLKYQFYESTKNPCQNNGICVPIDNRIGINQFRCLCTQEFQGTRCEYSRNRIDIELNNDIIETTTTIFAHFITSIPQKEKEHQHTTIFKKILFDQINITFYVKQPFHILFIELSNNTYYLTVVREKFIESELIQTKLVSNQRCLSVDDLLNNTFKNYSYLYRVKYYPLLCRQNQELKCFYDEHYMCVCDLDRFSNCFLFNHSRTYDCQGYIKCENEGKCFQDNITCPSRSICVCSDCSYGEKCQFSTKGFVLSLDYILGYHIKPNISISRQPFIIKMSIGITTIMFVFGLINGILSVLTFRIKKTRESGCGFYLFISSWISIFTIIVLILKFWYLVLSQMTIFTNQIFLTINCILLDVMINILLVSNDWLGACVSIERVFTVSQGVNFNKSKSKIVAKWITLFITIFTILTHLPDPIYRRLMDDKNEDEQRTWCLVKFVSSSVDIFNTFMTLFHFLVPFSVNLISSIIIVISISRYRSTIQPRLTFEQHLKIQIKKHQHHLISLFGLISLAIPRLIISFVNGCMKSPRNSWLFLFAYLLSFLPSMLTLFVSILPSKLYKDEFTNVMSRAIQRIRNIWTHEFVA